MEEEKSLLKKVKEILSKKSMIEESLEKGRWCRSQDLNFLMRRMRQKTYRKK
jgi:hypothetical protein